jgi:hypothetical protein
MGCAHPSEVIRVLPRHGAPFIAVPELGCGGGDLDVVHRRAGSVPLCYPSSRSLSLIQSLPLTRLYASADSIPPSTLRIFLSLTHLHLGDRPEDTEFICAVLSALPKLTHFATDNDKLVLVSHTILELSPSLRVLVFFEYYSKEHTDKVAERLTRDVRFVCMWPQNLVDD